MWLHGKNFDLGLRIMVIGPKDRPVLARPVGLLEEPAIEGAPIRQLHVAEQPIKSPT
jgi:hypothetical protein